MGEMIERVAKAMHEAWVKNACRIWPGQYIVTQDWESMGERNKEMFLVEARAAIEAMREPTYE